MIECDLEFDVKRRQGGLSQGALFVRMLNETIIFTDDAIGDVGLNPLLRFDGTWLLDGSVTWGAPVQSSFSGLMSLGTLEKGQDGDGGIEIVSLRRSTLTASFENVSGRISDLLLNEPLVGKQVEYFVMYPGLPQEKWVRLFKGEIESVDAAHDVVNVTMASS